MIANSSFATGWLVQVGQHLAIWQTGFEQFIRSRVGPSRYAGSLLQYSMIISSSKTARDRL